MEKKRLPDQETIDRRKFLKQFVALSALSFGTTMVCTSCVEYGSQPVYGPATVVTYVDQMTYLMKDGTENTLYHQEDVPIDAEFTIYFSDPMDESSQQAVQLKNAEDHTIRVAFLWLSGQTILRITPETELQYGTMHTLGVNERARNSMGNPLQVTELAQAVFRTSLSS
jgi:hypothetical protein